MDEEKLSFINVEFFKLLGRVEDATNAVWGKMDAQQMIEHVTAFFHVSTGGLHFDQTTVPADLPKYRAFLFSDKPFRENTKAPVKIIGENPLPKKCHSLPEAKEHLQAAVKEFNAFFRKDSKMKTLHPVFGFLNYEEWVLLHYKHITHHLRQFGISC